MDKFPKIIKKLRLEMGLGQEQLAEEMNVSRSTVGMWETGKRLPSKELYEQLADYFNVDIDYLYGRTNIRKAHHFDNDGNEYISAHYLKKNNDNYYLSEETRKIAQEIFEDEDMKLLFDLKKTAKADELMNYAKFLKEQYERENNL